MHLRLIYTSVLGSLAILIKEDDSIAFYDNFNITFLFFIHIYVKVLK